MYGLIQMRAAVAVHIRTVAPLFQMNPLGLSLFSNQLHQAQSHQSKIQTVEKQSHSEFLVSLFRITRKKRGNNLI